MPLGRTARLGRDTGDRSEAMGVTNPSSSAKAIFSVRACVSRREDSLFSVAAGYPDGRLPVLIQGALT
jgi:hypothetical protein